MTLLDIAGNNASNRFRKFLMQVAKQLLPEQFTVTVVAPVLHQKQKICQNVLCEVQTCNLQ